MKKMLIIYYTWAYGNTKRIADQLKEATGASMERIDTVEPYPLNYQETYEQGYSEVDLDFRPELMDLSLDIDDYDVIALGTPVWWYKMSPAMYSFVYSHNWYGKTIIPFVTCAGWPKKVMKQYRRECYGANIIYPFIVKFDRNGGDAMITEQYEIDAWIEAVKRYLETGNAVKFKQKMKKEPFFKRLAATFKKKNKQ
ncbi:MAG: flavodoxin [Clostridia bacterium]|nr:flavodoxin [Clostridia bacterium]